MTRSRGSTPEREAKASRDIDRDTIYPVLYVHGTKGAASSSRPRRWVLGRRRSGIGAYTVGDVERKQRSTSR